MRTPGAGFGPMTVGATTRRTVLVLGVVAGLFAAAPMALRRLRSKPPSAPELGMHPTPRELPNLRFTDGQGAATSLADFHGKLVLLNVWATWCPPCREEMPALDRLQALLGGADFEVLALSIDTGGVAVAQAFLRRWEIRHLRPYSDAFGDVSPSLGAGGIPLTLLIDREGREIGRQRGPAAWDHPRFVQTLRDLLARAAPSAGAGQR